MDNNCEECKFFQELWGDNDEEGFCYKYRASLSNPKVGECIHFTQIREQ